MNAFEQHRRFIEARSDAAFMAFMRRVLQNMPCRDWKPTPKR
jgi:hypothetical protein